MAKVAIFVLALSLLISLTLTYRVRRDMRSLSPKELIEIRQALRDLYADNTTTGWLAAAGAHGYPASCMFEEWEVYCCRHGEPLFLPWHRVYALLFEEALARKGWTYGLPYFDWGVQMDSLPELVNDTSDDNPWAQGPLVIEGEFYTTARDVSPELFEVPEGPFTEIFEQILLALEFENFCQFGWQLEMVHNRLHVLIGGSLFISMSSVPFAAYDPIFQPLHAYSDKVLAVYQAMQYIRGIDDFETYDYNDCNITDYSSPMEPFARPTVPFRNIRRRAAPSRLLRIKNLGYRYDNLRLNGMNPQELLDLIEMRRSGARNLAAFDMQNAGAPTTYVVYVCSEELQICEHSGNISVQGNPMERPWNPPGPYYYEVTKTVQKYGMEGRSDLYAEAEVYLPDGTQPAKLALSSSGVNPGRRALYAPVVTYPPRTTVA